MLGSPMEPTGEEIVDELCKSTLRDLATRLVERATSTMQGRRDAQGGDMVSIGIKNKIK
jgi:hypothetical protein